MKDDIYDNETTESERERRRVRVIECDMEDEDLSLFLGGLQRSILGEACPLSGTARGVFLMLLMHADIDEDRLITKTIAYDDAKQLMKMKTKSTIDKYLNELSSNGYLSFTADNKFLSYQIKQREMTEA